MHGSQPQTDAEVGKIETVRQQRVAPRARARKFDQVVLQPPWPLQAFWPLQPFLPRPCNRPGPCSRSGPCRRAWRLPEQRRRVLRVLRGRCGAGGAGGRGGAVASRGHAQHDSGYCGGDEVLGHSHDGCRSFRSLRTMKGPRWISEPRKVPLQILASGRFVSVRLQGFLPSAAPFISDFASRLSDGERVDTSAGRLTVLDH